MSTLVRMHVRQSLPGVSIGIKHWSVWNSNQQFVFLEKRHHQTTITKVGLTIIDL